MDFQDAITTPILLIVAAYLLGSINSAILTSWVMNLPDPRSSGSGNPGATNVLRVGNKLAAAVTLLGDLLKGLIPVLITDIFMGDEYLVAAVGLAALLGHLYPLYYRLQGGKGVATMLGVLLGTDWVLGVLWMLVWLSVAFLFRYSSLAALSATLAMVFGVWFRSMNSWIIGVLTVIALLIFWRHRRNISDLLSGKESKLGKD